MSKLFKAALGLLTLLLTLSQLPAFFARIETRRGVVLQDRLLAAIPPYNVSVLIFMIVWGSGAWLLFRAWKAPEIIPLYIWAYLFMCLSRIITISLMPLGPPIGMLPLKDPFTGIFYGRHVVTHDLFYSGHTATVLLIALCLPNQADKKAVYGLLTVLVALLIIQHIHYTADIVAAFPFAYGCFRISRLINNHH